MIASWQCRQPKIGTTTRHRSDRRQRPGRLHRQCEKLQEWQAIGRVIGVSARQHSSGGKQTLQGISKRVDSYLRTLLFYGARAVVRVAERKEQFGEAGPWRRTKASTRP